MVEAGGDGDGDGGGDGERGGGAGGGGIADNDGRKNNVGNNGDSLLTTDWAQQQQEQQQQLPRQHQHQHEHQQEHRHQNQYQQWSYSPGLVMNDYGAGAGTGTGSLRRISSGTREAVAIMSPVEAGGVGLRGAESAEVSVAVPNGRPGRGHTGHDRHGHGRGVGGGGVFEVYRVGGGSGAVSAGAREGNREWEGERVTLGSGGGGRTGGGAGAARHIIRAKAKRTRAPPKTALATYSWGMETRKGGVREKFIATVDEADMVKVCFVRTSSLSVPESIFLQVAMFVQGLFWLVAALLGVKIFFFPFRSRAFGVV